ncbi:MAG: hypothetical protein PF518_14115 [Spirochaetaceae bacterium]|nr:hypothetical protein [Spirochaetaceae bacterium]
MVNKKNVFLILFIFLTFPFLIFSQENLEKIPDRYHDFIFGDLLNTVKDKLKSDSYFSYRGDPDVSMMLAPDKSIIDTAGSGFINRAYFIFYNEKLYQITLVLNEVLLDFYTFQTQFTGKYGNPDSLDPSGMVWEDEKYRISLEYPLSIKYIDLEVFNALLSESEQNRSNEEILRTDFINTF